MNAIPLFRHLAIVQTLLAASLRRPNGRSRLDRSARVGRLSPLQDNLPASLRRVLTRAATLLAVLVAPALLPAFAQSFAIESWSVDGGGGTSAGSGLALSGTIGQPDAGVLSGGGFTLVGGLPGFHVVPAGPVTLTVQLLADGRVQVTWPGAETGWQLEAASRLRGSPDWQTVTAPGATGYIAKTDRAIRFFRLVQP